jgi:hypothetical protein
MTTRGASWGGAAVILAALANAAVTAANPAPSPADPPPSPDELARAQEAHCFAGAWSACDQLRRFSAEADRHRYDASCKGGDANACALRGDWAFEHALVGRPASPTDDAARWYQQACRRGSAYGCARQASGLDWSARKQRRALYGRACTQGYAPACASLGYELTWNGSAKFPDDPVASHAAYGRACALGAAAGCFQVLLDLVVDDAATPDAREAARRDADAACQQGDPDSCGLLDDIHRCGVGFPVDRARAATYRDRHPPRPAPNGNDPTVGRVVSASDCP